MKRLSVLLLACALLPLQAHAWGRKGHAAVATLAEQNLTPAAEAQVQALLADDLDRDGKPSHRTTLAAVASWADEIRDIAPPEAYKGWHVRHNLVCSDKLGKCKDGHCVDQLIIHYAAVLKDRSQPARARNEALKWVMHLVGDEHQPLHSGVNIDGGGIEARIVGRKLKPGTTFHQVWDNQIAVQALQAGPLEGTLADLPDSVPLPPDAPTQWMIESRNVALARAYSPLPDFACDRHLPTPLVLDDGYMTQATETAREQMTKAGLRLAQLLNQLLE